MLVDDGKLIDNRERLRASRASRMSTLLPLARRRLAAAAAAAAAAATFVVNRRLPSFLAKSLVAATADSAATADRDELRANVDRRARVYASRRASRKRRHQRV